MHILSQFLDINLKQLTLHPFSPYSIKLFYFLFIININFFIEINYPFSEINYPFVSKEVNYKIRLYNSIYILLVIFASLFFLNISSNSIFLYYSEIYTILLY